MFTVFAYFLYIFYSLDIFILTLQIRIAAECNGRVCKYSDIPAFISGLA